MKRNSQKNFIWNSIGVGLNSILSFFFILVVTRINGVEVQGKYSYVFSLALIAYTISSYGGRTFQVSDWKSNYKNFSYLVIRIISSVVSLIVIFLFSIINNVEMYYILCLIILILAKILESISDVLYGIVQKENELYKAGYSLSAKAIFCMILYLLIDIISGNLILASFSYLFVNAIGLFYDISISKNKINFIIDKKEINDLFKSNFYLFALSFLIIIIVNLPRYISKGMISPAENGYLSIFLMIPTIISLFGIFITQPLLIDLTNYYNNKDLANFNNLISKLTKLVLYFSLFGVFVAITFGPWALNLIFNINFNNYKIILSLVIISGMFNVITSILSNSLTIMRKIKEQFYMYLITLLVGTIIIYFMLKWFGFNGIFVGYMLMYLIQITLFYSYKKGVKIMTKKAKKKILHIFPDSLFIEGYLSCISMNHGYNHQFILTDIGSNLDFDSSRYPQYQFEKLSTFKFCDFVKLRKKLKEYDYDLLIVHSGYLNYLLLAFMNNKKVCKKTILSLWGGSDSKKFEVPSTKKQYTLFGLIYESLRKKFYQNVKAFASIVPADFETVQKLYNLKCKAYESCYPFVPNLISNFSKKNSNEVKIQICHSGSVECNTLELLDKLAKYKNDNVKIYASLCYGDKNYISKIIEKGQKIFNNKFIPIIDFMPSEEYAKYISNLDILMSNTFVQQGLGNVYLALASGVKVYIPEGSVLWNELKKQNIIIYPTSSICEKSIKELVEISQKTKQINYDNTINIFDTSKSFDKWGKIFREV